MPDPDLHQEAERAKFPHGGICCDCGEVSKHLLCRKCRDYRASDSDERHELTRLRTGKEQSQARTAYFAGEVKRLLHEAKRRNAAHADIEEASQARVARLVEVVDAAFDYLPLIEAAVGKDNALRRALDRARSEALPAAAVEEGKP